MRRPQFSLKTTLWLVALTGAFFGGIRFDTMPRPQFSLKTMLWVMAGMGAFLGGGGIQRRLIQLNNHPSLGGSR